MYVKKEQKKKTAIKAVSKGLFLAACEHFVRETSAQSNQPFQPAYRIVPHRLVSGFVAVCMMCCIFSALPQFAKADANTVIIESKEDFIEFAEKCTLDSRSQGKSVRLAADIDFSDGEFVPVPTSCGILFVNEDLF